MASPILKWAGGKRQLLDEIRSLFPIDYYAYHEPFFGGGAVFFDIEPEPGEGTKTHTINDTNIRLTNFYKQVRDNPNELIRLCETFKHPEDPPDPDLELIASENGEFAEERRCGKNTKNFYYQQRELFNRRPNNEDFDPLVEAAQLLYLNRTCFNGLFRENSSGEFNTPIGGYTNPDWVRKSEIRRGSDLLKHTEIYETGFEYVLNTAKPGDLVYMDPPYEPMSPTAYFTSYNADDFGREDQERLLEVAQELDKNGVYVILSNSGVMFDMYNDAGFYVEIEGASRSINSDGGNRDEVEEIIATNIPPTQRVSGEQTTLSDLV